MKEDKKKKAKKKSFFFEDYTESQIIYDNKYSNYIKVSLGRVTILFFVFFSLIFIFCIKIVYVSLFQEKNFFSEKNSLNFLNTRADIVDRNGIILARNINIYRAGIRPKFIKDKKKFIINLRLKFPELDINEIKDKLSKENKMKYMRCWKTLMDTNYKYKSFKNIKIAIKQLHYTSHINYVNLKI